MMAQRSQHALLNAAVLLSCCEMAQGTVNVTPSSGVSKSFVSDKWQITITATPSLTTLYEITGTANDDIRWIHVVNNGSDTSSIRLDIGGSLNDVEEIIRSGGDGQVWIIALDINGDLGAIGSAPTEGDIRVHLITDENQIDGDILGQVLMSARPNGDSTIEGLNVGGDILNDIRNTDGRIEFLNVGGDISGLSPAPDVGIVASGGIGTITAANIIDVGFPGSWPDDPCTIDSIILSGGMLTGGNPTPGILEAPKIGQLTMAGDLETPILIVSGGTGTKLNAEIGGSITSTGSITFPSGGLNGRVVVNAGLGSDTWTGNVVVGSTTLAPEPFYDNLPSTIGGGAVGEAPFSIHALASDPVAGSNIAFANRPGPSNPIVLDHYGRVTFTPTAGKEPVIVSVRACGGSWRQLGVACYDAAIDSGNVRGLIITPTDDIPNGFEVLVEPAPTTTGDFVMLSNFIGGAASGAVDAYDYAFTIGACATDFDGDEDIDSTDLNVVLNQFGNSSTCFQDGDVDADGDVDSTDLNVMLTDFGGDCNTPCSGGSFAMMGGGTPAVVEHLGFDSVAEFISWFDELSSPDQLLVIEAMKDFIANEE